MVAVDTAIARICTALNVAYASTDRDVIVMDRCGNGLVLGLRDESGNVVQFTVEVKQQD